MNISSLLSQTSEWLRGQGKYSDIVLCSRIRLARNLMEFPFTHKATYEQKIEIEESIVARFREITELQDYTYLLLDQLPYTDICFLFERRLISKELVITDGRRSVFFNKNETVSIMLNEEDHLRLQGLGSGESLAALYQNMLTLDQKLEKYLPYGFHPHFGYITACPTNVGTGLRASVMLHLPGLRLTSQIDKLRQNLAKTKINLRGSYGEGTTALGDFFQLSNQITLGLSEKKIISMLEHLVPQIIQYEKEVRTKILYEAPELLSQIKSALPGLESISSISIEQAMSQLSLARLAVLMDLAKADIQKINQLFLLCQPEHIQRQSSFVLGNPEQDIFRATLIRNMLGSSTK